MREFFRGKDIPHAYRQGASIEGFIHFKGDEEIGTLWVLWTGKSSDGGDKPGSPSWVANSKRGEEERPEKTMGGWVGFGDFGEEWK